MISMGSISVDRIISAQSACSPLPQSFCGSFVFVDGAFGSFAGTSTACPCNCLPLTVAQEKKHGPGQRHIHTEAHFLLVSVGFSFMNHNVEHRLSEA